MDKIREEWLQDRQDGRVYPLGRALRDTFHADNHDTLGSDVTGLMIDLSKVPFEPGAARPAVPAPPPPNRHRRPSMLAWVGRLFGPR